MIDETNCFLQFTDSNTRSYIKDVD